MTWEERVDRIKTNKTEYTDIIKYLKSLHEEGFVACCAGGWLRRNLGDEFPTTCGDIDIYVQVRSAEDAAKVKNIHETGCRNGLMQTITVKTNNLPAWFEQTFDFRCCMIWMDRNGLILSHPLAPQDILNKRLVFNPQNNQAMNSPSAINHVLKLIDEGWSIELKQLARILYYFVTDATGRFRVLGVDNSNHLSYEPNEIVELIENHLRTATAVTERTFLSFEEYQAGSRRSDNE